MDSRHVGFYAIASNVPLILKLLREHFLEELFIEEKKIANLKRLAKTSRNQVGVHRAHQGNLGFEDQLAVFVGQFLLRKTSASRFGKRKDVVYRFLHLL